MDFVLFHVFVVRCVVDFSLLDLFCFRVHVHIRVRFFFSSSFMLFSGKKAQDAKRRAAGDSLSMREDEMEVALKKRKARDAANQKYDSLVKASIKGTKRENMQSQELLRMEMQMAYKHGALLFFARRFVLA